MHTTARSASRCLPSRRVFVRDAAAAAAAASMLFVCMCMYDGPAACAAFLQCMPQQASLSCVVLDVLSVMACLLLRVCAGRDSAGVI